MIPAGGLALVLDLHLPYAPDEAATLEALVDLHLPLLATLRALEADGVPSPLTLALSPTATALLADERVRARLADHLRAQAARADAELERTRPDPPAHALALALRARIDALAALHEQLGGDLLAEYRRLQDTGRVEVVTTPATQAFLPLMNNDRAAMRAQVEVAVAEYERALGRRPAGIRSADCGHPPGGEDLYAEAGLRFFFVAPHGLLEGSSPPLYGVFAPVACPGAGVAAFARHEPTVREIEALAAADPDWRVPGTLWRVTGPSPVKDLYDPERARRRAAEVADDLVGRLEERVETVRALMDRAPLLVVDLEGLAGRWFEAPWFLEALFRRLHARRGAVAATTPSAWLAAHPVLQELRPALSSLLPGGYAADPGGPEGDWILPHLHHAAERLRALARRHAEAEGTPRRLLAQAARELLLAQAADGPRRLAAGDDVDGVVGRLRDHLAAFHRLADALAGADEAAPEAFLAEREARWPLFGALDPAVYAR